MNKKAIVLAATVSIVGLGVLGASAALSIEDPAAKLARLEAEYATIEKKLYEMPNQTQEEQDATVAEGQKIKQLGLEIKKVRLELDPDDEANFLNQLDTSIGAMWDGISELKDRAKREQNPEYLKQAEKVRQEITKFEKGKEAYLKKEKTVRQLRKELDIPVN